MKKISILALHLGHGGVENAICTLSNMLCDDYSIEIASVYKLNEGCSYELNNNIVLKYLTDLQPNKKEFLLAIKNKNILSILNEGLKSIKILFKRKQAMKEYVKQCDSEIIISTRFLFNTILGKYHKKGSITISQEHRHHDNDKKYIKKLIKSLKKIDYFMPVSQELTEFYKNKIGNTKAIYIEHAVDYIPSDIDYKVNKHLISIGRLSPEKGFLDLIDVFNNIYIKDSEYILNIFGDGVQKNDIIEKINKYHLQNNVILHGFQNKTVIHKYLSDSSIFMLGSFSESFGLVLIEAMSFGIPCFAFSTAQGAHEIIDGHNGMIIEDRNVNLMSETILNLKKEQLVDMSKNALKTSQKYSMENVKAKWLTFLKKS